MPSCLVILPSYNSGEQLPRTMLSARKFCDPVWAVLDGCTDGSEPMARALGNGGFRVIPLGKNSGKGAAVLVAFREALEAGFTHAIVMDADGQHDAEAIPRFLELSAANPAHLIAGVPVFGPDAPPERVKGRLVGNFFARLETWGLGASDSLFGFRLYPLKPALEILESTRSARRFDFDTVLAVRLLWAGVPAMNVPVAVRYPPRAEGGVTHFHYLRDNLLLTRAHVRLCLEMLLHIPRLLSLRCH
ncbi:MAG: glycosyltransferase family 2 protein [Terrimicrobiaceae bacterium]